MNSKQQKNEIHILFTNILSLKNCFVTGCLKQNCYSEARPSGPNAHLIDSHDTKSVCNLVVFSSLHYVFQQIHRRQCLNCLGCYCLTMQVVPTPPPKKT